MTDLDGSFYREIAEEKYRDEVEPKMNEIEALRAQLTERDERYEELDRLHEDLLEEHAAMLECLDERQTECVVKDERIRGLEEELKTRIERHTLCVDKLTKYREALGETLQIL